MSDFFQLFEHGFILRHALWGSVAVGFFCPLIGVYFMLRRMVLMGVALPQISAAGIAFAFFLQGMGVHWSLHPGEVNDRFAALAGSLLFTLGALLILAILERKGDGAVQNRIGAFYSVASALAILLVAKNPSGKIELLGLLQGEIVTVGASDLTLLLSAFALLTGVLLVAHRSLLMVSFDRDFARTIGKNVAAWDVLLYSIIGIAISLGVLIAGPMLTFAAFVIPPLAVRRFCRRMPGFFLASSLVGGFSGLAGFYVSYHYDLPLGPTNVAVFAVVLLICVLINKVRLIKVHA